MALRSTAAGSSPTTFSPAATTSLTFKLAFLALAADLLVLARPTFTSTLLSFRLSAWAWPWSQVRRWELVSSEEGEDKLVIRAGPDVVIVIGRGLATAHAALDLARLHTIRETPARQASYAEKPWVRSIAVETAHDVRVTSKP